MSRRLDDADQRQTFPVDSARLWDALLRALETSPFTVKSLNKGLKRAEVASGLGLMMGKRSIVIQIEQVRIGESTLVVMAPIKRPTTRAVTQASNMTNDLVRRVATKLS
jgi:hypothetical protein